MSTEKPLRRTIFRSSGQQLRRGKACLNCRHLKIKCDGVKPACGQCVRIPKDDECEYTDGPSRTKELQDTIAILQRRVHELEQGRACFPGTRLSPVNSAYSSSPSSSPSLKLAEESPFLESLEPPVEIIELLLDAFLPHAPIFGFCLNVDHFRQATLLPLPFGDKARPTPGLLYAVYLWGAHLSNFSQAQVCVILGRALRQLAMEVTSRSDPARMIHTIQAQVLLATYFLRNDHLVESDFHTTGAVSLVLSYDLHRIRSARMWDIRCGVPPDAISEAERISAFWTVFCLDRVVKVTLGHEATSFGFLENPLEEIDTPWPTEDDACSLACTIIQHFVKMSPGFGPSDPAAWYTQSVTLFYRASLLYTRWLRGVPVDQIHMFLSECHSHRERILTFLPSVAPLSTYDSEVFCSLVATSLHRRTLLVTHALLTASSMKIQAILSGYGDADASSQCVLSAQWILEAFGDVTLPDFLILPPVVGGICVTACEILVGEIQRISHLPSDPIRLSEQARLRTVLFNGMTSMGFMGVDSPLLVSQLRQVQVMCNGL